MKKKIVYIAGYGRSGSTLLDIILGNHHDAASLGEIGNLFELYYDENSFCSCGANFDKCVRWSEVLKQSFPDASPQSLEYYNKVQHEVEKWSKFHRLLIPKSKIKEKTLYIKLMRKLIKGIFEVTGKSVAVDSSKSAYAFAWRALALCRLCGFDVRVIHLVRDGRGVINSKITGNNRTMRKGIPAKESLAAYRGLFGWIIANFFAILTGLLLPRHSYHLVRYEDFISKPEVELTKLGHFLQLNFSKTIKSIKANGQFHVEHLVAGNRLTRKERIRLKTSPIKDISIPSHIKLIYYLFAWPLLAYLAVTSRFVGDDVSAKA